MNGGANNRNVKTRV